MKVKELKTFLKINMFPNVDFCYGPFCEDITITHGKAEVEAGLKKFFRGKVKYFKNMKQYDFPTGSFSTMSIFELLDTVDETVKLPYAHCAFVPVTFINNIHNENYRPFYQFFNEKDTKGYSCLIF